MASVLTPLLPLRRKTVPTKKHLSVVLAVGAAPALFNAGLHLPSTSRGAAALPQNCFVRMASSSPSRAMHSSPSRHASPAGHIAIGHPAADMHLIPEQQGIASQPPLSVLPLRTVLRSLAITTLSSSPILLPPSLALMSLLANTNSALLSPDRNPLLRYAVKKTFYAQFCAGETPSEVRRTIGSLKTLGFSGVILGYAKEVVLTTEQTANLSSCDQGPAADECVQKEIIPWAVGTMETVRLAEPGDFVALKFTGAGRQALYNLSERLAPTPALANAIDDICTLAASRGIRLLFDAEQQAVQAGIDDWTLAYMRKYNTAERAVIYGTYQAYLKSTPATLSGHLKVARDEGFALGVKLVRGAYLGSDPRHLIHATKADTDSAYDGIAEALLRRQWQAPLVPNTGDTRFPAVNMVLASHNAESVRKARAILDSGVSGTQIAFAQLQGMADEVSCDLLCATRGRGPAAIPSSGEVKPSGIGTNTYKYAVWGSTGECMKYLLRRAQENRDAVQRTKSGRDAMRAEVWRRIRAAFHLA